MFSVEFETGCRVLECLGVPPDDLEINAIVFRVAANTIPARRRCGQHRSVITAARGYARRYILMAFQAAILSRTRADLVTRNAARRSVPLAVRFRERPRTDLRRRRNRNQNAPQP